jgi:hypothetical protein
MCEQVLPGNFRGYRKGHQTSLKPEKSEEAQKLWAWGLLISKFGSTSALFNVGLLLPLSQWSYLVFLLNEPINSW